jgi:uncharacterized protein DUF2851
MTEKLFQFIWQFQYYNRNELQTESGEPLQIIFPGQFNASQGPDFLEAKIKIGQTTWAGNIELHIKTSDWQKHAHDDDKNYNNVILHVVWENDLQVNENGIPLIILHDRVSKLLLMKYEEWMKSQSFIPCEKNILQVNDIIWTSWKQRLLIERLQRKTKLVENYLQQNNHHWEETFWWMLARNFGYTVNAEAFEAMAKTISVNILAKHKNQIHQLEALLLGQCGLLENDFTDTYPLMLQKEYSFLKKKYQLKSINLPVHFLRMRPGNFPTIRLAQLAVLIQQSSHLFSVVKEIAGIKMIKKLFAVEANDYWHYHYVFDEESSFKKKLLGQQMTDNIIINTIVHVIFAYGHLQKQPIYKNKALQWLEELSGEKNSITNGWENISIKNKTAFDSQSLIELKTQYCDERKCLQCALGNTLLKKN